MKTLIEQIKTKDSYAQFNLIPGRIFLDTNALQYLQDFGEYVFEHYRESEEYFQTRKRKKQKETKSRCIKTNGVVLKKRTNYKKTTFTRQLLLNLILDGTIY
jgi:hypothetical protein